VKPPVTEPPTNPGETVLLVEGDPGLRQLLKLLLTRGGGAAEQIVLNHTGPIPLVVTDVILPDCDGPEVVSRLQLARPLCAFFTSGYPEQTAAEIAGLPFLQKPFTTVEFGRQVRAALDRKVTDGLFDVAVSILTFGQQFATTVVDL